MTTLRKKTVLIVVTTLAVFLTILLLGAKLILNQSYERLEEEETRQSISHVMAALSNEIAAVNATLGDWARWDDTYDFVQDRNHQYISDNLDNYVFENLRLNLIVFIDSNGQIVHGTAYNLNLGQKIPVPKKINALITSGVLLSNPSNLDQQSSGAILVDGQLMAVAAQPILNSAGEGPAQGILVMGRYLDDRVLEKISKDTLLEPTLVALDNANLDPSSRLALATVNRDNPLVVLPVDYATIAGFGMIYDLFGEPIMFARVDLPRSIYQQGQVTLNYFFWLLFVFGGFFCLIAWFLLERFILSRLAKLNHEVHRIGESADLSTRVSESGHDELSSLASTINGMLSILESSKNALRKAHDELEQRVNERTTALAQANQELQSEIAERSKAEKALALSEERYALATLGSNNGIWDVDLQTRQAYYSPRWKSLLGYSEDEIGSSWDEWLDRVHPDDIHHVRQNIQRHLDGELPQFESEHRILHKDGTYIWVQARGTAVWNENQPVRLAGSLNDITDRKFFEEQLKHDAMHDMLTMLPNRAYFMAQLKRCVERVRRRPELLAAVLLLDLDRFKLINDSLGHHIGDQLLISVSRRLEESLRPGDTIARMGGDEFAILLEDIHQVSDAIRVARRIQDDIGKPFTLDGHDVFTSTSIGIALTNPAYTSSEEMLRDADTAMYRAKANGKARHEIFDKEMHAQTIGKLQLEADIRRAVDRREFTVYYQPMVSLTAGKITRVEALTRWQHPTRGLVPPSEFIPLAEETGLIIPIGAWVLETACRQARTWHDAGYKDLGVAVNIAALQLQDPYFETLVSDILEETGLPAQSLELEITENTAMQDVEQTYKVLRSLRALGVGISIDDFGISYSSLGYLKRFPVTTLKIDRSFIADIDIDNDSAAIVKAILAMGRVLKLRVVAEGVEELSQMNWLASQFCDEAQGFLVSPAVPADRITGLIQQVALSLQPA